MDRMIYCTLTLTREDILQLMRQVDLNVFCLWQNRETDQLFGAIKESAYEFFISACSVFTLSEMVYLTAAEIKNAIKRDERNFVCGNKLLM
jgi:hypothetical protein